MKETIKKNLLVTQVQWRGEHVLLQKVSFILPIWIARLHWRTTVLLAYPLGANESSCSLALHLLNNTDIYFISNLRLATNHPFVPHPEAKQKQFFSISCHDEQWVRLEKTKKEDSLAVQIENTSSAAGESSRDSRLNIVAISLVNLHDKNSSSSSSSIYAAAAPSGFVNGNFAGKNMAFKMRR